MIESDNPLPPVNPNNSNNDIINNSLPPVSNNNQQIRPIPQRIEPINQNQNIQNDNPNNPNDQDENKEEFLQVEFMKPNSNYFFQILLVIHTIYSFVYFILEMICFICVKSFPPFLYGYGAYGIDIFGLIAYFLHQVLRFHNGNFGNRTESSTTIIMSFPVVALFVYPYFWALQSYVLRIEEILNIVGVAISIIETAFLVLAFLDISKQESSM
jgi:hypothetical protein